MTSDQRPVIVGKTGVNTLARSELLNQLGVTSDPISIDLNPVVKWLRKKKSSGIVYSVYGGLICQMLPPIIECNYIPDNVLNISTPEVARSYPNLRHIANELPNSAKMSAYSSCLVRTWWTYIRSKVKWQDPKHLPLHINSALDRW